MLTLLPEQNALLVLVRQALFSKQDELNIVDWQQVERVANEQGVLSMLYIGASKYKSLVPADVIREWRGIMYSDVMRNEQLNSVQTELIAQLQARNIAVAVLKGLSVAWYYRHPDMRCLGDIDILIDKENVKETAEMLKSWGYTQTHIGHVFHSSFEKDGVTVEVHHEATEVPHSEGGTRARHIMNEFLSERRQVQVNDTVFPVLSDTHQALMLLLHMERHMTEMDIGLRQVCDWAAFVDASDSSHWEQHTLEMLEYCGLLSYAKVVTKACVAYLGLEETKCAWCMGAEDELVDRFMEDAFRGGNLGAANNKRLGSAFTDRSLLGQKKQGLLKGVFVKMTNRAYSYYPVVRKYKVLLPLCWLYLPFEYLVRSFVKMPDKRNWGEMVGVANKRRNLINDLHLYETNKRK